MQQRGMHVTVEHVSQQLVHMPRSFCVSFNESILGLYFAGIYVDEMEAPEGGELTCSPCGHALDGDIGSAGGPKEAPFRL